MAMIILYLSSMMHKLIAVWVCNARNCLVWLRLISNTFFCINLCCISWGYGYRSITKCLCFVSIIRIQLLGNIHCCYKRNCLAKNCFSRCELVLGLLIWVKNPLKWWGFAMMLMWYLCSIRMNWLSHLFRYIVMNNLK